MVEEKVVTVSHNIESYRLNKPIFSANTVLYAYKNKRNEPVVELLPSFTSPELPLTSNRDKDNVIKEFLFFSKSLNEEFIVHLKRNVSYTPEISLHFYRSNGEYVSSYTKEIKGLKDNRYFHTENEMDSEFDYNCLKVSQNGRFLYYITSEENPDCNQNNEPTENSSMDGSKKRGMEKKKKREFYPESYDKYTAHIVEIVLVRKKKVHTNLADTAKPLIERRSKMAEEKKPTKRRVNKSISRSETKLLEDREKERSKFDRIKQRIKQANISFELKEIRKFDKLDKYFGRVYDPILTDIGTLASYEPEGKRLFYEKKEVTEYVNNKLGESDFLVKYKIEDYSWKILQTGFLGYREERMYYLNLTVSFSQKKNAYDVKMNYSKVIPMSFILGESTLRITSVTGCIDPTKVVMALEESQETIILVWSLEKNSEVRNVSIKGDYFFAHGSGSQIGYVFCQDKYYINLDHGIPNYYFGREFTSGDRLNRNGYKINKTESMMLLGGKMILKSEFVHVDLVNSILQDPDFLSERNISPVFGGFQFKGNTIFHLFALEADKLQIIIDHFIENCKEALYGLVLRNDEGLTPIDITIKRESTKTTDIMLRGLSHLDDGIYSVTLFKDFPKLIMNGLKSFRDYLDTCTFQTVQMKNMNMLSLRKKDATVLYTSHSSCLLDRYFLEKHTVAEKQNQEYIKEKKNIDTEKKSLKFSNKKLNEEKRKLKAGKLTRNKINEPVDHNEIRIKDKGINKGSVSESGVEESPSEDYDNEDEEEVSEDEEEVSEDEDLNESDEEESKEDSSNQSQEDDKDENKLSTGGWLTAGKSVGESSPRKSWLGLGQKATHIRTVEDVDRDLKEIEQKGIELERKDKRMHQDHKRRLKLLAKTQKRYEIKACEFDWLFNEEEGKDFLYALSETEYIEIFSLNLISNIIIYLWGFYRTQIILKVLIPFLAYFAVFLIYSTWISYEEDKENGDFGDKYYDTNFAMLIFIMIGIAWMGYYEFRQLMYYKHRYFLSFWNWVDVSSLGMNIAVVATDFANIDEEKHVPILAVATLLMWLKLCYFGRIFLSTAWMIRMIYVVTKDMGYFLLVFSLMVIGFANTFYILARNGSPEFAGTNFGYAIVYTYKAGLGTFDVENFAANRDEVLVYLIWLLSTFLILIVLLNMLIAIISDIFEKVHENIHNNLLKELAVLMVETELLISRKSLFKDKKYMIIIEQERSESVQDYAETQLAIIRKNLSKKVQEQQVVLKTMSKNLEEHTKRGIDNKGSELEGAVRKEVGKLSEKFEAVHRFIDDCIKSEGRVKIAQA